MIFQVMGERHKVLNVDLDTLEAKPKTQHLRLSTPASAFWDVKHKIHPPLLCPSELCGWPLHTRPAILVGVGHVEGNVGASLGVEADQLLQRGCLDHIEAHLTTECAWLPVLWRADGIP